MMEMTFRWYGDDDPVTLNYIRQIPAVTGIVSALYGIPAGEEWPLAEIAALKKKINDSGLAFSVIESIPVHEDIKLGKPGRERLIENYCRSIRNMGFLGIGILCYNFMPVFDWTRSNLYMEHPDGSNSLSYEHDFLKDIDLRNGTAGLPGWASGYTRDELENLLDAYSGVDDEKLWSNLAYFLDRVIPVAEESGVRMGIHPDDPPWPIFGLPRIIKNEAAFDRLISIVDSRSNGITFCTGSLAPGSGIDVAALIKKYSALDRVPFVHCRNIRKTGEFSFYESAHPSKCGDIDMYKVIKALADNGFSGAVRPDHGRMIWGEKGRPGYGLYDRALGAMYLYGLIEAVEKGNKN